MFQTKVPGRCNSNCCCVTMFTSVNLFCFFSFLYSLINVLFTPRTTTSTGPFRPVPNNPVRSNLPPACSIPNHWRATCRTIPFSPHRPRAFVANRNQERHRGRWTYECMKYMKYMKYISVWVFDEYSGVEYQYVFAFTLIWKIVVASWFSQWRRRTKFFDFRVLPPTSCRS